jgi:hypothetical protein
MTILRLYLSYMKLAVLGMLSAGFLMFLYAGLRARSNLLEYAIVVVFLLELLAIRLRFGSFFYAHTIAWKGLVRALASYRLQLLGSRTGRLGASPPSELAADSQMQKVLKLQLEIVAERIRHKTLSA